MRTGLTSLQTNILDQDVYKDLSWLFEVDLSDNGSIDYYWSTKKKVYGGNTYSDIDGGAAFVTNFSPIKMRKGYATAGIMVPSTIQIAVANKGSSLVPSTFVGAAITVRLVIKADIVAKQTTDLGLSSDVTLEASNVSEDEVASWGFVVQSTYTVYQTLYLSCVDWLSKYMQGDYPNTPLISTLWPAANVPSDNVCVPKIFGTCYFPIRWTKADVTGDDLYVLGEYNTGETHTITECRDPVGIGIGVYPETDSNHTFTITENKQANDNNYYGTATFDIFGTGANIFWERHIHPDMPCKYSNSATVSTRSPIEIIKEILLDMGIPTAKINSSSYETAKKLWEDRGLYFDAPFWYKQSRPTVLANLLTQCDTTLIIRNQIYFKVNSVTSQHTCNNSWILKGSAVGKGSFVYRSINVNDQKDSGHILIRPSDKTIDDHIKVLIATKAVTNYISETVIDCLFIDNTVDAQKIGKIALQRTLLPNGVVSATLKPKCLQLEVGDMFTIEGSDYNAISNYDVLLDQMTINRDGSVAISAICFSSSLDDWDDLSATAVTVIEDDTSGGFYSVYAGQVTPGEASGGNLIQIDGSLKLPAGEDIILTGNDSDPAQIKFEGTTLEVDVGVDTAGTSFAFMPRTSAVGQFFIGSEDPFVGSEALFSTIQINSKSISTMRSVDTSTAGYDNYFRVSNVGAFIHTEASGTGITYTFTLARINVSTHKATDIGTAAAAFDDAYADDFNNVADFYCLDDYDDLGTIEAIKSSAETDERTGFLLIDDDTLPEWLLVKNKETKEIEHDPDGKPYVALKTFCSLLMGGIKEIILWLRKIDSRLDALENTILNRGDNG